MASSTLTQTNNLLRDAVANQLEWESDYSFGGIGVSANDNVVTLTGFVDSYAAKLAAERAAKRVRGVRVVANDIQVRLRMERPDPDLAADIAMAIRLRPAIPESVQAVVHNGQVTLTGRVPTLFLRALAADVVRHVHGVKRVDNHVEVGPAASFSDLRRRIVGALHRSAEFDARNLTITIEGSTVVLSGQVDSWSEAEAAENAVAHAPGVTAVDNRITVSPHLVPVPPDDDERG